MITYKEALKVAEKMAEQYYGPNMCLEEVVVSPFGWGFTFRYLDWMESGDKDKRFADGLKPIIVLKSGKHHLSPAGLRVEGLFRALDDSQPVPQGYREWAERWIERALDWP